jgi:hypothetical protein
LLDTISGGFMSPSIAEDVTESLIKRALAETK